MPTCGICRHKRICRFGAAGAKFCFSCYQIMLRHWNHDEPKMIAWFFLRKVSQFVDETGSRIRCAYDRSDIRSLIALCSMSSNSVNWGQPGHAFLALTLAYPFYWNWPMQHFMSQLWFVSGTMVTRQQLTAAMRSTAQAFKGLQVRHGVLVAKPPGKSPIQNPSERRPGTVAIRKLISCLPEVKTCMAKLATDYFKGAPISVKEVYDFLLQQELPIWSRSCKYSTIRYIRAMIAAFGFPYADTEQDWVLMRSMSNHVADQIKLLHLSDYLTVIRLRDYMRETFDRRYSLSDLIVFICLAPSELTRNA
jgi:hypothetical protein